MSVFLSSEETAAIDLMAISRAQMLVDRDVAKESRRLERDLADAKDKAISEVAQKHAVQAVAKAIMREIAALEAGKPIKRQYSAPQAAAARAEAFIDTARSELMRLSEGRLDYSARSVKSVKHSGRELREYFAVSVVQPEPELNSDPRTRPRP